MSLPEVAGVSAIVRIHSRTIAGLLRARELYPRPKVLEDEELALIRIGRLQLQSKDWLRELDAMHWKEGADYVLVDGHEGVLGTSPDWLHVVLEPTGNPPELEARMDPEVRAMWEATRRLSYSFSKGPRKPEQ